MKFFRFALSILIAALLLAACGTPAKPVNAPLRVAANLWPGTYPVAIAQEMGFFAKHHVNVKLVYYNNYRDTYADFVAEKIDVLDVNLGDILPISTQKNLKFVFPADSSDGADVLVVAANIKTASDLKGKRIGVHFGTYAELFVRAWLKQNGIAASDVTWVNIRAENAAQAFPDQIDAVHTYEPYGSNVVKKGGHVLMTSSEMPNFVLGILTSSAKLVKDRPQDIQAFTDAWFEAVDWMHANPEQASIVVAKAFGIQPADVWFDGDKVFTRAEAKALMQPGETSASVYFTVQSYVDFMVNAGTLTTRPKPENLIDSSFLK